MKKFNWLGFFAVLFFVIPILTSCVKDNIDESNTDQTETVTYDCPNLSLNVGDTCLNDSTNMGGIVNTNCECESGNTTTYDCPSLALNYGDACTTSGGAAGTVDTNCVCIETVNSVDCPFLGLNFGDACTTPGGASGTVDTSCVCIEIVNSVDCPSWGLNYGDDCSYFTLDSMTMDTILVQGILDTNCICL